MPALRKFAALQPLPGVAAALAAGFVGYAVRYGLVEPEKFGAACETAGPWWCLPRTGFIMFTEWNGFGWLSILFAAIAGIILLRGGRPMTLAMAAMVTGGAGTILYNATFSVIALVAAMLLLAEGASKPA